MLDSSFGSHAKPLFVIISTQSNDPEHILSKVIDDGLSGIDPAIVCPLHAADEGCELDDEAQWFKADPALDVFRDREDLAAAVRKAKRLPAGAEDAQPSPQSAYLASLAADLARRVVGLCRRGQVRGA